MGNARKAEALTVALAALCAEHGCKTYIVAANFGNDAHDAWRMESSGSCLRLIGLADEIKRMTVDQVSRLTSDGCPA